MSDFSSLLSQFASKATDSADKREEDQRHLSDQNSRKKRPLPQIFDRNSDRRSRTKNEDTTFENKKRKVHIRDLQDLTVRIDFLGIGAQKAGTSWLHTMLSKHPNVSLPLGGTENKELHFWDWNRRKGLKWYSNQFSSKRDNVVIGEFTPCYAVLSEEHVAEVNELFPTAKLIFIARDLVERAYSAIVMEIRNSMRGLQAGQFAPGDLKPGKRKNPATKEDEDLDLSTYSDKYFIDRLNHSTHATRSDYETSLRRWLKYYPSNQLLVLDYRSISDNPKKFLEEVCRFLQMDFDILLQNVSEEDMRTKINAAKPDSSTPAVPQLSVNNLLGSPPDEQRRPSAQSNDESIRPSLRKKMRRHLQPKQNKFNELLKELGYAWKL